MIRYAGVAALQAQHLAAIGPLAMPSRLAAVAAAAEGVNPLTEKPLGLQVAFIAGQRLWPAPWDHRWQFGRVLATDT